MRTNRPAFQSTRQLTALFVLRELARRQRNHERSSTPLLDLSARIGVTRSEVRAVISALHVDGYVDALRLRVTLSGFALGTFLDGVALPHPAAAPVVWSARAA